MRLSEEQDELGNTAYCVEIGDEVLSFPSAEAREKFLFRLWLDLLQKMLRSQLLQEALEWLLWEQQQEKMRRLREKKEAWAMFVLLLLQQDQQYYLLPADLAQGLYMQQLARDWVVQISDFVLTAHRLVPVPEADEEDKPRG